MLTLLGLQDDYVHDGRVIVEPLYPWAVPQTLRAHREMLERLGKIYKQVNAAFGRFAMLTLKASTKALKSGSTADDSVYTAIEAQTQSLTDQRDMLASQMKLLLDAAAFKGQAIGEYQARELIEQGERLLRRVHKLARG